MTRFTSGCALVLLATLTLGLVGCADSGSTLTSAIGDSADGQASLTDQVTSDSAGLEVDDTAFGDSSMTAPDVESVADHTVADHTVESDDANTDDADQLADNESAEDAEGDDQTAEFVNQIQTALQGGDLSEGIRIAEQAREELPGNEQLAMILLQLSMQQAQADPDQQVVSTALVNAEKLIEELSPRFNPEQLQQTRAGLSFLKARNQLATGNPADAIELIHVAREGGFPVEQLLERDPVFQPLMDDEEFAQTLRDWMIEGVRDEIATNESFPFEFSLTTYDDAQTVSLEDHKGKIVIVDFWGTWCPPCKMEIPHFIELQDKYSDDLAIIGINYEHGTDEEAKQDIAELVQEMGINYPCVIGDEETQSLVPDLRGFPTTLFIDRTGKVRLKAVGYHPYAKLEAIVETLMAEGKS